jgi:hypothetical protein
MKEIALVLAQADLEQLGALRCLPQLVAAWQGDRIWLRGIAVEQAEDPAILRLPALARYHVGEDQLLFLPGAVTPVAYLPTLAWQPITAFIVPEMPVAAYGGIVEEQVPVTLVPAPDEQPAIGLRCTLAHLQAWCEAAPEVRIQVLHYAVAQDGDTIVLGDPLPTIPGQVLWECEGLLLPAGHALAYPVLAATIVRLLDAAATHRLLLHADGSWERISRTNFIPATRSGIRQTTITP